MRCSPIPAMLATMLWLGTSGTLQAQEDSTEKERRGKAQSVTRITPTAAAGLSFSDLIGGRAPGLNIYRPSGLVGIGGLARIRGVRSLVLSNDPIIEIDGVVVPATTTSFQTLDQNFAAVSNLDLIDPDDIERVEVLRGLAASIDAGPGAVNGVIRITTKRGRSGGARWMASTEGGLSSDPAVYPTAYQGLPIQSNGLPCVPVLQGISPCQLDRVATRNLANDPSVSILTTGIRQRLGLEASGGNRRIRYYLSGAELNQQGVYRLPDGERRYLEQKFGVSSLSSDQTSINRLQSWSGRANLDLTITPHLLVRLSGSGLSNGGRLPDQGTGDPSEFLTPLLIGNQLDSTVPWFDRNRPADLFPQATNRRQVRLLGGVDLRWNPSTRFAAWARGGLTRDTYRDTRSMQGNPLDPNYTQSDTTQYRETAQSADAGASWTFGSGSIRLTSSGVVQYRKQEPSLTYGRWNNGTLGISSSFVSPYRSVGVVFTEEVAVANRVTLGGTVRRDRITALSSDQDPIVSGSVTGAWQLLNRTNDDLAVRGSWSSVGRGLDPTLIGSIFLSSISPPGANVFSPFTSTPERVRELEFGLAGSIGGGHLSADVTWFRQSTEHGMGWARGVSGVTLDDAHGRIVNQGLEASLALRLIGASKVQWNLQLAGSVISSKIEQLDIPAAAFRSDGGCDIGGFAPSSACGQRLNPFVDLNGDGILNPNEVPTQGPGGWIAATLPTRALQVGNDIGFRLARGWLTTRVQLDYQGGFSSLNSAELYQCFFAECGVLYTPGVSLQDQVQAFLGGVPDHIESASFARWRELTVSYRTSGLAHWAGARNATISITGYNLLLITGFHGLDPEVRTLSGVGPGAWLAPPLRRSVTLRIGFEW